MDRNDILNQLRNATKKVSAGILIKAMDTNRVFLLKRAFNPYLGHWSVVSGKIDKSDSNVLLGLKREVKEELQINPDIITYKLVDVEKDFKRNSEFHYYHGFTDKEFVPTLDNENEDYGWFSIDEIPKPEYPTLTDKVSKI